MMTIRGTSHWLIGVVMCSAWALEAPLQAATPNVFVSFVLQGRPLSGHVLRAAPGQVVLLQPDGKMLECNPAGASGYTRQEKPFTPLTAGQLRASLQGELGGDFEITGTGHYLVAHPRGTGRIWAERFEDLYREFSQYFQVRGLQVEPSPFPLVAIVWPEQSQFLAYARRDGMASANGVLGYYSRLSNRITLFDVTAGNPDDANWRTNAETIIHEAVHQCAFNRGLHRRYGGSPAWIVEGLGTMFESNGVNNSTKHPSLTDRVNAIQLQAFREFQAKRRPRGCWADLVMRDQLFSSAALDAYAESWAFSFFLSETRPKQYAQLLAVTAKKPAFEEITSTERWNDFVKIFGSDVKKLESQFLDYIASLR